MRVFIQTHSGAAIGQQPTDQFAVATRTKEVSFASIAADSANMKITDFPSSRTVVPTSEDLELARQSSRQFGTLVGAGSQIELRVQSRGVKHPEVAPIPMAAFKLLVQILSEMADGNAVTVIPMHREMTSQEAADFLEMSRPSLLKLLDQKEIRFRKVGKHRRVLFQDVIEYKKREMADRHVALDELAQQAQELGLGY